MGAAVWVGRLGRTAACGYAAPVARRAYARRSGYTSGAPSDRNPRLSASLVSLFEPFSHYLAYLATDQETYRDLRGQYDGLLVPGTIAAWQRQGTGGFVLSLSAAAGSPRTSSIPAFRCSSKRCVHRSNRTSRLQKSSVTLV